MASPKPEDEADALEVDKPETYPEASSQKFASFPSDASRHEELLHQGIPSKLSVAPGTPNMQPRVVTIAFSSPVASDIPQQPRVDISDSLSDDEDFLPPEDSDDGAVAAKKRALMAVDGTPTAVNGVDTEPQENDDLEVGGQLITSI